MAGFATRRSKAKGSTREVRTIERRLRAWLRNNFPDRNCDDLMDAVCSQALTAARNGVRGTGADGAAARAEGNWYFADLATAITAAIAAGIGLKEAQS
ncbi:hypothetical protein [Paracoccus sp. SY]|uniref:hypothetical protein n=1 Tax=Paracoccus sp. SY TaxID=1330255 RepID=UPI000CD21642|nr:hypothetical protein [Paracoccus sp. SY]